MSKTADAKPANLTADSKRKLRRQLDVWRSELLALDRRQRLIYFKHLAVGSLEVVAPLAPDILESLSRGPIVGLELTADEVTALEADDQSGSLKQLVRSTFRVEKKTPTKLKSSLTRLSTQSQQVYADRGYWTLYLGMGMLSWKESDSSDEIYSPLLLCPVELSRSGVQAPFSIARVEDEDIILNPALKLKLEQDFDIALPEPDPDEPDLRKYLAGVTDAIADQITWSVAPRVVMTQFSFHKEAIYRDLADHESHVLDHPLVQQIALGSNAPSQAKQLSWDPSESDMDEVAPPEKLHTILDSDSSQRACVVAARDGLSFVMDGPPGTGKSQTIANVIAELMTQGKSVLFVSEKAAALDVVRDRLTSRGLGDFLLELHSHAATRKEVIHQLDRALKTRARVPAGMSSADRDSVKKQREKLTAFAGAMNETRPGLDRSLVSVLGELLTHLPTGGVALADLERWKRLKRSHLDGIGAMADTLARAWRPVSEGNDFLWRDLTNSDHSVAEINHVMQLSRKASSAAAAAVDRAPAIDIEVGLSFTLSTRDLDRRRSLLEVLEKSPTYPDSWLTTDAPDVVEERFAASKANCEAYQASASSLLVRAGNRWDQLDPERLSALVDIQREDVGTTEIFWVGGVNALGSTLARVQTSLERSPVALAEIVKNAEELAAVLGLPSDGMSISRACEIARLAQMAGATARPERDWLNPAVQSALDESARVLTELVVLVRERQAAIHSVFTPQALDLDLASLNTRFKTVHTGMSRMGSAARRDRKLLKSVSVSGKADKGVQAALDEAVAWQAAETRLTEQEGTHASRLGSYYRRSETDLDRLLEAVEITHLAVQLAGGELDQSKLADQLAVGGRTDARLLGYAEQILKGAERWQSDVAGLFEPSMADDVETSPMTSVVDWSGATAEMLRPAVDALTHVSEVTDKDFTLTDAAVLLDEARMLAEAAAAIFNSFESDQLLMGETYQGVDTDWAYLDDSIKWAMSARALIGHPVDAETALQLRAVSLESRDMAEPLEAWLSVRDEVAKLFEDEKASSLLAEVDADLRAAGELFADMSNSAQTDIPIWDSFVRTSFDLSTLGLSSVVDVLVERNARPEELKPQLLWSSLQAWLEWTIGRDARLKGYASDHRDALVHDYRDNDRKLVDLAYIDVANACSARRPKNHHGAGAVLISREAQKKSRHKPIREVLEKSADIVQELKPCFMMSPLSVSQFLPGGIRFDVVIFDEASQVLPSDAVNCIYRGTQLIVAGDDKQLPPTSFFQAASGSSDEEDVDEPDEFESILTVCKSGVMPQLPLSWHYRSQHEHLITFSNYQFYAPAEQPLQSFPGAVFEAEDLGVKAYFVDGIYRRGASRDNPIEAEAVVDRIAHHRRAHPGMSIGVVTLSSAQQDTVLATLERRAQTDSHLATLLSSNDRLNGFFVKSIENVQGDERDLIILSIGYGRDETGKIYNNFGAINTKSGWRRLNVAITRARRRVEVVSSLRSGDIAKTENESILHLQKYLAFAEHGPSALATDLSDSGMDVESPFEADVLRVIEGWGYDVIPQVGVAGYRIDLGIRHPERPGEYLMGVECDGAAYHSARSARDRDRLRGNVLEGLGWNLHRIWGISWYRDRRGQSERLHQAIRAALDADGVSVAVPRRRDPVETVVDAFEPSRVPEWAVEYVPYAGDAPYLPYELGSFEAQPAIKNYLKNVIRAEAPIHLDLIHRRVRDAYAVGRIGSQIRRNIDSALVNLIIDGAGVSRGKDEIIRLGAETTTTVRIPRDESNLRKVSEVPRSELIEALAQTVNDSVSIDQDALFVAVARLFGWKRLGNDVNAALAMAYREAVKANFLVPVGEGRVRRPS